jgi:S-methylmethionine-dependent homocysteine/selenocysteine methylase
VPGTTLMRPDEAADYHRQQVQDYKDAGADRVSALTLSYVEEAVGIAAAASDAGIPAVIGFTLETDGRLPSGTTLEEAISTVDASTASYPSWYLVNCAHPDHIAPAITEGAAWTQRIGGLRANASRRSHAELDEATELDAGDPEELAQGYVELARALPALSVVGGCCGTDVRHVAAIARAMSPA